MDRFRVFTLTLGVLGFCLLYAGTAVQSSREHWEGRSQQLLIQQEVESTKFEPVRPEIWRKKAT